MCATRILRHRLVIIKKFGFLQGFTGGRDRRGCVLGMEHLLIVGSKKVGFLQGFAGGGETEEGVCFQWVLKVVGATIDGFLR